MKKYLLTPVLLLSFLCGATSVLAYDTTELLTECAEKEGWTYGKLNDYPTVEDPGEDPVGYYTTFFKIWHCFRNEQWNDTTAVIWRPQTWFDRKSIGSFARTIGFPTNSDGFITCEGEAYDACNKSDRQCSSSCSKLSGDAEDECGRMCIKQGMECRNEKLIGCEGELEAWAMAYARKLVPEKKEPECDPSEYLVGGRCQSVFELCGRDSLFRYNESTGECYCPDLYEPHNGMCVHVDDLYPPVNTPPKSESSSSEKPQVIDDQDFPPDDPRNMFCQPPEGAEAMSYNEFGIPIAHAQIYSNYSTITHLEGEVLIMTKNAPRWAPAFKGQRITVGDKIKTSRKGSCEVKFANSAIYRMRPLSQLEIPDHKNPCNCYGNLKVGYLDMYWGKVWSKVKPISSECEFAIKTPTAIAGGSERGRPMYDYYDNDEFEVAYDVFEIPLASAEDGDTILHASHDEDTQISKFYVEEGEVTVSDINETASVVLSAGETMSVAPDTVPHEMDVQPASQVAGQWWEEWEDDSGLPIFIPIILYIAGLAFVIRKVLKSKLGIFMKIGMFIFGFIIMNFITAILMMFV